MKPSEVAEIRRQRVLNRRPAEMPAALPDAHFRRPAGLVHTAFVPVRFVEPIAEVPGFAKPHRGVGSEQPAVVVHEFPIGEDHADVRVAIQVVLDAPEHVLRLLLVRRVRRFHLPGRFIVGQKQADRRLAADLARQLGPVARIDYAARLHRLRPSGDLVDFLALEKERPQLRDS